VLLLAPGLFEACLSFLELEMLEPQLELFQPLQLPTPVPFVSSLLEAVPLRDVWLVSELSILFVSAPCAPLQLGARPTDVELCLCSHQNLSQIDNTRHPRKPKVHIRLP